MISLHNELSVIRFIFLQTTLGTFVNDEQLEPNVEKELFEDDEIGLGVKTDCDKSDRTNFVFRLKKTETVELNSDSDDDDRGLEVGFVKNVDEKLLEKSSENEKQVQKQPMFKKKKQSHNVATKNVCSEDHKKTAVQLIDPLSLKRNRRKSVLLIDFEELETVKKKRGRPRKNPEEIKEKIKMLPKNSKLKEVAKPKGKRALKLK